MTRQGVSQERTRKGGSADVTPAAGHTLRTAPGPRSGAARMARARRRARLPRLRPACSLWVVRRSRESACNQRRLALCMLASRVALPGCTAARWPWPGAARAVRCRVRPCGSDGGSGVDMRTLTAGFSDPLALRADELQRRAGLMQQRRPAAIAGRPRHNSFARRHPLRRTLWRVATPFCRAAAVRVAVAQLLGVTAPKARCPARAGTLLSWRAEGDGDIATRVCLSSPWRPS